MAMWSDIAAIVFVATTINHLGLISAIESAIDRKLWIVDCPKCLSFWLSLFWLITSCPPITALAVSLLASYSALWLELAEAYLDSLYLLLYEKIKSTGDDNQDPADANNGNPAGSMS